LPFHDHGREQRQMLHHLGDCEGWPVAVGHIGCVICREEQEEIRLSPVSSEIRRPSIGEIFENLEYHHHWVRHRVGWLRVQALCECGWNGPLHWDGRVTPFKMLDDWLDHRRASEYDQ
jgi:hypothetical protein